MLSSQSDYGRFGRQLRSRILSDFVWLMYDTLCRFAYGDDHVYQPIS